MRNTNFPVLLSLQTGFRFAIAHWPFIARLIAFPILITFFGFLAHDTLPVEGPFWATIFKVPGDFIKGIFLALYIRFLLFNELPAQATQSPESQSDLALSALLYTAVQFVYGGVMTALLLLYGPEPTAGVAPSPLMAAGSLVGLAAILWLFRYEWLPVGAAAGHPMRSFTAFLGHDWGLSLRIFALWVLASLPAFFALGLVGQIVMEIGDVQTMAQMDGPGKWLFFFANAIFTTLTATVTAGASVFAIRHCMKGGRNV